MHEDLLKLEAGNSVEKRRNGKHIIKYFAELVNYCRVSELLQN